MYGFDIVIKVPELYEHDLVINEKTLENHIEREKNMAVENSKRLLNK